MSTDDQVDWARRYADEDTPWDLQGPHPEVAARLATPELQPSAAGARALVPGCGRGHDALALARAGWRVTALDLVDDLGAGLEAQLAGLGGRFVAGDALAFEDAREYELVLEHTFFCAIPRARRGEWGALVRRLLVPGGRLWALVFPADKPLEEGGPPHRTTAEDLLEALGPGFALEEQGPVGHAVERRQWAERWARFRRAAGS